MPSITGGDADKRQMDFSFLPFYIPLPLPPPLPAELLLDIFEKSSKESLKTLRLVCRKWNEFIRGISSKSALVKTVSALDLLAKETSVIRDLVRELNIDIETDSEKWTAQMVVDLLQLLPNLTSLRLHLNQQSPGVMAGSYDPFTKVKLPKLTRLEILFDHLKDGNSLEYKITSIAPNIHTLGLGATGAKQVPHDGIRIDPATFLCLPALTTLEFRGTHAMSNFIVNQFISEDTIDQVTRLRIWGCANSIHTPIHLPRRVGARVHTLEVDDIGRFGVVAYLNDLGRVKHLTLTEKDWPTTHRPREPFPESVATVVLKGLEEGSPASVPLFLWRQWDAVRPGFVTKLELCNFYRVESNRGPCVADPFFWLADWFKMDITVNGLIYRHSLEERLAEEAALKAEQQAEQRRILKGKWRAVESDPEDVDESAENDEDREECGDEM